MGGVELAHLARISFLARLAEEIACRRAADHLTLLRFTSGWKLRSGRRILDSGTDRHEVGALPAYPRWKRPSTLRHRSAGDPCGRRRSHSHALEGRGPEQRTQPRSLNAGRWIAAGALEQAEVEDALYAAAVANGLVAEDGERQCWATIRSSSSAGLRKPVDLDADARKAH